MSDARRFVERATAALAAAGVESPRHDAEELLAFALGTTRQALRTSSWSLPAAAARRAEELVDRRAARVPLQHLTGSAGFRYLDLAVGPGVFVPRPETELLAGAAVDELARLVASGIEHPVAVDLCTGSGAVAAAMATEVPASRVTAVELSVEAVAFATRNASPVGVDIRQGDMADAVDDLAGSVHVVTANPPYIPLEAFESVSLEARDHDPPLALWSGADGLDAIRVVERVAARLLVSGGLVLCEHADVQGESARHVFGASGSWSEVRDNLDLAGRPRFVSARRLRRRSDEAGTIGE